jgi:hypothetical protein
MSKEFRLCWGVVHYIITHIYTPPAAAGRQHHVYYIHYISQAVVVGLCVVVCLVREQL